MMNMNFTESALAEIQRRLAAAGTGSDKVRLGLAEGGCAGTSYVLECGVAARAGEREHAQGAFVLLLDPGDEPLLQGLEVDFVDSLVGGGFRFRNPNAARHCGCGASFAPLADLTR